MICKFCEKKARKMLGGVLVCDECTGFSREKQVKLAISTDSKTEVIWISSDKLKELRSCINEQRTNTGNRRKNKRSNEKGKASQPDKAGTNKKATPGNGSGKQ